MSRVDAVWIFHTVFFLRLILMSVILKRKSEMNYHAADLRCKCELCGFAVMATSNGEMTK